MVSSGNGVATGSSLVDPRNKIVFNLRRNFVKMFDAGRTRMIGLPYGEKNYGNILSRFHLIPERNGQTDGQTDGRTDLLYQYRASVC